MPPRSFLTRCLTGLSFPRHVSNLSFSFFDVPAEPHHFEILSSSISASYLFTLFENMAGYTISRPTISFTRSADQTEAWRTEILPLWKIQNHRFLPRWLLYHFVAANPETAIDQNDVLDSYYEEFGAFKETHPLIHPEELTEMIRSEFEGTRCVDEAAPLIVGLRWATPEEMQVRARATIMRAADLAESERKDAVVHAVTDEGSYAPRKPSRRQEAIQRRQRAKQQREFRSYADAGLIDDVQHRNIFSQKMIEDPLMSLGATGRDADGNYVLTQSPLVRRLRRRATGGPLGDEEPGFPGISMRKIQNELKHRLADSPPEDDSTWQSNKETWQDTADDLLEDMKSGGDKYTGRKGI